MACLSSDTVRLLYTWMLSHLDINGNFYADPIMVNNLVFTRLGHSIKIISSALDELAEKGLIVRYQVNGERYLKYPDFFDKQPKLLPFREGVSEIPDLTEGTPLIESNLNIIESNINVETTLTEKSLKNNSRVNSELKKERQESFLLFYKAYPRKVNKREAFDRWIKANLPDMEVILRAIEDQKKSEQWMEEDGKYIPHPSTWINKERWNDELKPHGGNNNGQRSGKPTREPGIPKEYRSDLQPEPRPEDVKRVKGIVAGFVKRTEIPADTS